jgi:hypothetical protein
VTAAVADAVAVLERTPLLLDVWLRGLPDAWLDARTEGPESFSPRDVLGHLIGGERRDWIPRMRIIIEHGEKRAFDPFDRFAFRAEIAGKSAAELLDAFAVLRRESLGDLRALHLTPEDLARKGRHPDPAFAPVTLGELLSTWTVHDLSHIGQVARVMAKRYGDAVGPWKAYLPVLTR